jgi:hypothetical protein
MCRLAAGITALALLWASPVQAWDHPREIVHGSARVLEKRETIVGIVSPLGYGLVERVTIFTHPALLLLLTPNIWARISLLDDDSAVAFETGYQQSVLVLEYGETAESDSDTGNTDPAPGYFQAGVVVSQVIGESVQLSAATGYLVRFGGFTTNLDEHNSGLYYRLNGHLLFNEANLILAEVRGNWFRGDSMHYPTGTLIYARQLGRTRLGIGAAFGEFPISTDFTDATDPRSGSSGDTVALPVYPWVDLWWRF